MGLFGKPKAWNGSVATLDLTYGHPSRKRSDQQSSESIMVNMVATGPVSRKRDDRGNLTYRAPNLPSVQDTVHERSAARMEWNDSEKKDHAYNKKITENLRSIRMGYVMKDNNMNEAVTRYQIVLSAKTSSLIFCCWQLWGEKDNHSFKIVKLQHACSVSTATDTSSSTKW